MKQEHKLNIFEIKVCRKVFKSVGGDQSVTWSKWYKEEFLNEYFFSLVSVEQLIQMCSAQTGEPDN
jgi:hypothetical protein